MNFGQCLGNMWRANGKQPCALFMDNLVVHKTAVARGIYKTLQIWPIFNLPYSPSDVFDSLNV